MSRAPSVLNGDCLTIMPTLEAESIDAIVTDPPYGLKFMGKAWDHGVPASPFWIEALRVAKPGAHLVAFGGTRTYHRLTCAIEDAGWEIRDCLSWLYGSGFPKSHNGPWGGTALKPGWEPCILARKPLVGTVEGNHAKHGTGALNIDGCRIECEPGDIGNRVDDPARPSRRPVNHMNDDGSFAKARAYREPAGRWPANVVLDEEAARLLDEQSGERTSGKMLPTKPSAGRAVYGKDAAAGYTTMETYGDSGGASRFFYTAKAPRNEREAGLREAGLREAVTAHNIGQLASVDGRGERRVANTHPTVKPLALMQWLCRLVTPKGGLILDPFCGSGSTGRAAVAEGFSFVGIELSEEYAQIARARIAEYAPLFADGAA